MVQGPEPAGPPRLRARALVPPKNHVETVGFCSLPVHYPPLRCLLLPNQRQPKQRVSCSSPASLASLASPGRPLHFSRPFSPPRPRSSFLSTVDDADSDRHQGCVYVLVPLNTPGRTAILIMRLFFSTRTPSKLLDSLQHVIAATVVYE